MKTEPNDLMHSFNHTADTEGNFKGLTKREYMAMEFTKAQMIGIISASGTDAHGWSLVDFANAGVLQADALIKELNR